MTRAPGRLIRPVLLLAGVAVFAACDHSEPTAPPRLQAAASGGGGLSVNAATPSFGRQGETGKRVTVTGSGFKQGAQASWKLDGGPTSDVVVLSTDYVSSTQLIATIDIASTAELALYDVAVTQAGRKGIGTESIIGPDLFEVTTAIPVVQLTTARRANDNGELSGSFSSGGAAYFNTSTGFVQQLSAAGSGYGISDLGDVIVGVGGPGNLASLWTRTGPIGSWQETALPLDPTSGLSGRAPALVTDPVTGRPTLVGGFEIDATGPTKNIQRPILWVWQAATSSWQRVVLPTGSPTASGEVVDLSSTSVAVGVANGVAAVWTPNGSGGYVLTTLGGSRATGIDGAATVISGRTGTGSRMTAVYWKRSGSSWIGPITLPGGCDIAKGVSDTGRMVLNSCPFGNKKYPAYIDPPYTTPVQLHGLGPNNTIGEISNISPSGRYVSGTAQVSGADQGIYWKLY